MSETLYHVVRNHEDQHSLWTSLRPAPGGWEVRFGPASKEDCLAYIREHWTDITPLSARAAQAPEGR